jgi:hypothetical protein
MQLSKQQQRSAAGKPAGRPLSRTSELSADDADVHSLLWKSYLPQSVRPKVPPGYRSLPEILEVNRRKISKPLLGIAVWNQVPIIDPNSSSPAPVLDPALERLLHSILDLDGNAACVLRASPLYDAFPPYPDQLILDTRYTEQRRGHSAVATLEICVPTPSDPRHPNANLAADFNRFKSIADPRTWPACKHFWSHIEPCDPSRIVKQGKTERSINARLHLPGETGAVSRPVKLEIVEFSNDHPLHALIRFQVHENAENALIKLCHGHISVQKEPGRPGAARIRNRKIVQFAAGGLEDYAFETLRYWLQAETVTLIDAVLRASIAQR